MTHLEKCPVCDKGYLRPTGTDDTSDVKEYQCDNSDCEMNKTNDSEEKLKYQFVVDSKAIELESDAAMLYELGN